MGEFCNWFLAGGGIIHPHVEIASDSTGFYLRALSGHDITEECLIISCPHNLIISWPQVVHDPDVFLNRFDIRRASDLIDEAVITRFFLIREYFLKEKSRWWPYIRMLPQPDSDQLDTPLWYGGKELIWIQGTNLEFAANMKEKMWREEYEEGIDLLNPAAEDSAEQRSWSWNLYKWAATIFSSRAFPGPALATSILFQGCINTGLGVDQRFFLETRKGPDCTCPILIPGVDLMNHNPAAKVTWTWGKSECLFSSNEVIRGGSQIWNNYGPKGNEELIMGYGFSVFRNSADVFVLAVSSVSRQKINKIKSYLSRRNEICSEAIGLVKSNPAELTRAVPGNRNLCSWNIVEHSIKQTDEENERNVPISSSAGEVSQELHWVRLKTVSDSTDQRPSYEFSPYFFGECSMVFSNKREIATGDGCWEASVDFSSGELSRNKVHVICAITMMLQKHWRSITQHSHKLPRWPESKKAFHAARYRRNQIHLLSSLATNFLKSLRTFVGIESLSGRDRRVVRLEHILTQSPPDFLVDFRATLNAGLGTRNPIKIRSKRWVECTFTLWLCGLYSWRTSTGQALEDSGDPLFTSYILAWLCFLERIYGQPHTNIADEEPLPKPNDEDSSEEMKHVSFYTRDSHHDTVLIARSYLTVVEAALKKNPHSVYRNSDVTVARLVWCLNIIREESVMCPNLEGKVDEAEDELILFMETS